MGPLSNSPRLLHVKSGSAWERCQGSFWLFSSTRSIDLHKFCLQMLCENVKNVIEIAGEILPSITARDEVDSGFWGKRK